MKTTSPRYTTTAAYISGAITGKTWMPAIEAGIPINDNMRGPFGFYSDGDSFRDALNSLLMRKGGDFQNPAFTADTVLRIERRKVDGPGKYQVHIWEREITQLHDCADLVNESFFSSDFFND